MKEKKQQPEKSPEKKKEQLSRKDWEDIMGVNMQVLTKKNGAWKRK